MLPRCKTFRASVCSILAILVFIHTTPLYAQTQPPTGGPADTVGQDTGLYAGGPSENSSTGAATYSVPIAVPPGRGGISPNLAITYNSYQGNGWLGVGFLLDMGAIQRSTKTQGGITYSMNDQFVAVANGSMSNLVARSDWGPNCYENQIEGAFLNYCFNTSTGGWQVKDKGGTIYYYGTSASSQQQNSYGTYKWLLDRVVDRNGNYMTVEYWQNQGQVYLSNVDYTGNPESVRLI